MTSSKWRPWLLTFPALTFVLVGFVVPILWFLSEAYNARAITEAIPKTTQAIRDWHGVGLPADVVFEALVEDLGGTADRAQIGALARELNFRKAGYRTIVLRTSRSLRASLDDGPDARSRLVDAHPAWGEAETWQVIRSNANPVTDFFLLSSLDLERTAEDVIRSKPEADRLFLSIYLRTAVIAFSVTVMCVLLGYPVAYLLATCDPRWMLWLLVIVLLPFWTSLLVRTLSWMVIFQREGILNALLLDLGLVSEGLQLLRTRFAVYVSMVHILLPFMILPLFSVMRRIPKNFVPAAESLGAGRLYALMTVYLPLTLPGLGAGVILVLTLSLGFYITPMLLGGGGDQMISFFIATYVDRSLNWGLAAALGAWLMLFAFVCFFLVNMLTRKFSRV